MTYTFKLARRIARLRAPLLLGLVVVACGGDNAFDPTGDSGPADPVASAFAGGIPFGISAMPLEQYGSRYNGALLNLAPKTMLAELAQIKSRGGKVIIKLAGHPRYYGEGDGFDLADWKSADRHLPGDRLRAVRQGRHDRGALHDRRAERSEELGWQAGLDVDAGGDGAVQQAAVARAPDHRENRAQLPRLQPSLHRRGVGLVSQPQGNAAGIHPPQRERCPGARTRARHRAQHDGRRRAQPDADDGQRGAVLGLRTAGEHLSLRLHDVAVRGRGLSGSMGSAMDVLSRLARNRSIRTCRRGAGGSTPQPPPPSEPPPSEPPPSDPEPPSSGTGVPFGPMAFRWSRWTRSEAPAAR